MLLALEHTYMAKLGLEPHILDSRASAPSHPAAHLPWPEIPVLGCSASQEDAPYPACVSLEAENFCHLLSLHPWYPVGTKRSDGGWVGKLKHLHEGS